MRPPEHWPPQPETQKQYEFREHREDLNRKLRAAWLAGLEDGWLRLYGRPITQEEMLAELERYPGDMPTER